MNLRFLVLAIMSLALGASRMALADPAGDRLILHNELGRLMALPAGSSVAVAIPYGKALHPGDQSPTVAATRRALAALGFVDSATPPDPSVYDDPFAQQVRRFQLAEGLVPDGIVGGETRKLLQVGLPDRIRMLQQTLDQPDLPSSGRFIDVNLAAGLLAAYDGGRRILTSRVVIGGKDTQTPVFSARVESVWLNPAWVVPDSIVQKEFGGNPHTEQPGPANPLGALLLSLPNRYEIFLHSTNEPALFDRDERPFSHGCVRVQEVEALSRWLLGEQRWSTEQMDAGLTRLTSRRFTLDQPVAVYIGYRTATVGPTGAILYHPDPYGFAAPPPDQADAATAAAGAANSGAPGIVPVAQPGAVPN